MRLISGCRYLKVNLKAKIFICVNSKGVPTKLLKFFWWKIFLICHRCQRHQWSTGQPWAGIISAIFRKISKRSLWDTLGLGGNWLMKKTRSEKSRDTVPLKSFPYLFTLQKGLPHIFVGRFRPGYVLRSKRSKSGCPMSFETPSFSVCSIFLNKIE